MGVWIVMAPTVEFVLSLLTCDYCTNHGLILLALAGFADLFIAPCHLHFACDEMTISGVALLAERLCFLAEIIREVIGDDGSELSTFSAGCSERMCVVVSTLR